jgi:hypothetical protein
MKDADSSGSAEVQVVNADRIVSVEYVANGGRITFRVGKPFLGTRDEVITRFNECTKSPDLG